jgi:type II secretory pathway predicted ATPase ExeA
MEYTVRYGLEFNPFLKNSKEVLISTAEYKETLFRLDYLVKTKGFGLLTGSPGKGKTTAVRNWSSGLNPSLYKVVYSSFSTLTPNDFYRNLTSLLGAQPAFRKPDNFRIIQDEITRLAVEKRKTPVIIIDEANYINNAILNDLKILFNFEMDSKDRAVILLTGLPTLNSTLKLGIHEPLRQRIVMNYEIDGLTKEEGRIYITDKLNGAGCNKPVFEDNALEAILNATDGTPRMINKLCNASLLIGDSMKAELITTDIVMKAVNESEL